MTDISLLIDYYKYYIPDAHIFTSLIQVPLCGFVKMNSFFYILVIRACSTTGLPNGCTAGSGVETCICSGDLCNSAGGTTDTMETTTNAAGVVVASTSVTLVSVIFTKFL